MKQVLLSGGALRVSRFCFGTARLHHLPGEAARVALLDAAVTLGFSHFDTAPLYGFGTAERCLATVLKVHPEVTVATKVGLYPPGGADQSESSMFMRKLAGKFAPMLSRAIVDWSVAQAERSLEGSLRRLKRDYVDILFLHEPQSSFVVTDELQRWAERLRDRARFLGISGGASVATRLHAGAQPFSDVLQVRDSISQNQAHSLRVTGRAPDIAYGYKSAEYTTPYDRVMEEALRRNPNGAILVSTNQAQRLGQYKRLTSCQ